MILEMRGWIWYGGTSYGLDGEKAIHSCYTKFLDGFLLRYYLKGKLYDAQAIVDSESIQVLGKRVRHPFLLHAGFISYGTRRSISCQQSISPQAFTSLSSILSLGCLHRAKG